MGKYVDITFKDKSWIFSGSVKTFECDPTETCGNCGGNGRCPSCNGQGETRCPSCGGRGINRCSRCGGGGIDRDGKRCYMCHGSGTIDCSRCHGKGYIMCNTCWGSGRCMTCGGTGEVTCERCQGTGFYQQYLEYTAYYCVRQLCHPGPTPDLIDGLRVATGEELYKAVCKLWRKEGVLAFDDTEKDLKKLCDTANKYETYAEDFKKQYEQTSEMQENIPEYMSYKNTLISSKIPATRIRYEINGKDYEMVLLGDNGVVCYDDLPKSIKVFEMSKADRVKQDRFARHRHKDLAKLTAYIFNLDGISPEESSNLYLIMKHMCLNANQRDRRIRYYSYRYTPEVSYNAMVRKMKHLLVSKKTISYVWQCIAVDREITPKEQEFFNRLVEQCNIPESELIALKRFSSKFATLDSSEFVKEYLDSDPVTLKRNLNPIWIVGIAVGVILFLLGIFLDKGILILPGLILGIGAFICFNKIDPPTQRYVEIQYRLASNEPEFDKAFVDGSNIFVRLGYGFVDGVMKLAAKIGIAFDRLFYSNNNVSKHETVGNNRQIEKSRPEPASSVAKVQSPNVTVSSRQTTQSKEETTVLPQVGAALVETPTKKSNRKPLIIGIIATLVILSALGVFYFIKRDKQQSIYEKPLQEQQAQYEAELEEQRQQQEAQQNKLKGYEWLEGVWAGCDEYGNFGRMIVTDSYYQVVNSNMDDAFDQVEKMEKINIELKNRPDYITGEGNGVSFGFDEYIRVDVEHHSIYIIQGEYNGIVLQKIEEDDFEAAVFEANHGCPPRVYSNAYDGYVNIRQTPQSKAPIVGVLHNGPEGAVLLGTEGEWKKIDCNGIVGYVYEKYVQDTPTEVYEYWGMLRKDASNYRFTESDLSPLTAKELTYLRNSVYAKHGYVFNSQELNNYFKRISWYHPDASVTEAALNSVERANVEFIKNYQERNGKTYKPQ